MSPRVKNASDKAPRKSLRWVKAPNVTCSFPNTMPPEPSPLVEPKSNVTMRLWALTRCGKKKMSSWSWISRLPDSDERLAAKVGLATARSVRTVKRTRT